MDIARGGAEESRATLQEKQQELLTLFALLFYLDEDKIHLAPRERHPSCCLFFSCQILTRIALSPSFCHSYSFKRKKGKEMLCVCVCVLSVDLSFSCVIRFRTEGNPTSDKTKGRKKPFGARPLVIIWICTQYAKELDGNSDNDGELIRYLAHTVDAHVQAAGLATSAVVNAGGQLDDQRAGCGRIERSAKEGAGRFGIRVRNPDVQFSLWKKSNTLKRLNQARDSLPCLLISRAHEERRS